MSDFGNLLYKLRKEKGWTQTELADKLNVTNQAVSKWENGDSFPETAQLVPLSELFGVTIDELLKGSVTEHAQNRSDTQNYGKNDDYTAQTSRQEEVVLPAPIKPESWRTAFVTLLVVGLALLFVGVVALILISIIDENLVMIGLMILLGCAAIGVTLLVYAGIKDSYYYLPIEKDDWQNRAHTYAKAISVGVMLCILAAAAFSACGFADNSSYSEKLITSLSLTGGFLFVAVAVAVFVVYGIRWSEYYKEAAPEYAAREENADKNGISKFNGVIMLLATAAFLLLGFLGNLWHPGWVVFPVGGILCAVFGEIDNVRKKK